MGKRENHDLWEQDDHDRSRYAANKNVYEGVNIIKKTKWPLGSLDADISFRTTVARSTSFVKLS